MPSWMTYDLLWVSLRQNTLIVTTVSLSQHFFCHNILFVTTWNILFLPIRLQSVVSIHRLNLPSNRLQSVSIHCLNLSSQFIVSIRLQTTSNPWSQFCYLNPPSHTMDWRRIETTNWRRIGGGLRRWFETTDWRRFGGGLRRQLEMTNWDDGLRQRIGGGLEAGRIETTDSIRQMKGAK